MPPAPRGRCGAGARGALGAGQEQLPPHWQEPPDWQPQLQPEPQPQAARIGSGVRTGRGPGSADGRSRRAGLVGKSVIVPSLS